MRIKLEDVPEVIGKHNPVVMKPVITRDQHSEYISITWAKIDGYHKRMSCGISDRPYYIIDGEGEFQVGDDESVKVQSGDFVFIPKGVAYSFSGDMTYLVMNGPAFLPGSDEFLE
jgi:ethanolamine utilization protein EutQ (cupin superfamily)